MASQDIYRVVIHQNLDGQKLVNILHYKQQGSDGARPPARDCAEDVWTHIATEWKAMISSDMAFTAVGAQRIYPTPGGEWMNYLTDVGGVASEPVPPNVVMVASLYTTTVGKRGRTRLHVSGYPQNKHKDGIIENSFVSTITAWADKLFTTATASAGTPDWVPVMWSAADVAHRDLTTVTGQKYRIQPDLRTMRGRRMEEP